MNADDFRSAIAGADAEARRRAVMALVEMTQEELAALAPIALGDEDWRVRKEAVRVMAQVAQRLDVGDVLIDAVVQGDNVGLRNAALETLGRLGHRASGPLLGALETVPEGARKFIVAALGDTGDLAVIDAVVAAAEGDDANVAAAGIDALARLGGPKAEASLRRLLASSDPFQRMAALDGLDRLRVVVPYDELGPLLEDRLTRRVALGLAGRTSDGRAVAPLTAALADGSTSVVAAACRALALLADSDDALLADCAKHLAGLGDEGRIALRRLLVEGDLASRQAAAHLLVLSRDGESLGQVLALGSDGALPPAALDGLTRWGVQGVAPLLDVHRSAVGLTKASALELAADLAGRADESDAVEAVRAAILDAVDDRDPVVRAAGVRSLSWGARPEDAALLVSLTETADQDLALACGRALESLVAEAPDRVSAAVAGAELDGNSGVALLGVVAKLAEPGAHTRIQAAMASDNRSVRRAAVNALTTLGGPRAASLISLALSDEDLDVRAAAARALGGLRGEDDRPLGVSPLLAALESDSPVVQATAAEALGNAGADSAREPLRRLAGSAHGGVAVAALKALDLLGEPDLGSLVESALHHDDEEVVKQALWVLRGGGDEAVGLLAGALSHPAWHVRSLAVRLLGEVDSDAATAALRRHATAETDPAVTRALDQALTEGRGDQ